eukprot:SAG31_NODE_1347_length_8693_cov_32.744938_2_plen_75_part_00
MSAIRAVQLFTSPNLTLAQDKAVQHITHRSCSVGLRPNESSAQPVDSGAAIMAATAAALGCLTGSCSTAVSIVV